MNLRFECQRGCINCFANQSGLRLFDRDRPSSRAAKFTGMSRRVFEKKYVYRTKHQLRFRKPSTDKQLPVPFGPWMQYSSRQKPTQCRTFPFWPELVENRKEWNSASRFCPGIGKGPLIQIGTAMEIAEQQRKAYPDMYR